MSETVTAVVEIPPDATFSTFAVMSQLRPHLRSEDYLAAVARMRTSEGFRLAAVTVDGVVAAVAGFRTMEMLYCGRILSVDDLISDETQRSSGHGKRLIDWLMLEAARLGCRQVHLDSGLHRLDAHRFYDREGFTRTACHFVKDVPTAPN